MVVFVGFLLVKRGDVFYFLVFVLLVELFEKKILASGRQIQVLFGFDSSAEATVVASDTFIAPRFVGAVDELFFSPKGVPFGAVPCNILYIFGPFDSIFGMFS